MACDPVDRDRKDGFSVVDDAADNAKERGVGVGTPKEVKRAISKIAVSKDVELSVGSRRAREEVFDSEADGSDFAEVVGTPTEGVVEIGERFVVLEREVNAASTRARVRVMSTTIGKDNHRIVGEGIDEVVSCYFSFCCLLFGALAGATLLGVGGEGGEGVPERVADKLWAVTSEEFSDGGSEEVGDIEAVGELISPGLPGGEDEEAVEGSLNTAMETVSS